MSVHGVFTQNKAKCDNSIAGSRRNCTRKRQLQLESTQLHSITFHCKTVHCWLVCIHSRAQTIICDGNSQQWWRQSAGTSTFTHHWLISHTSASFLPIVPRRNDNGHCVLSMVLGICEGGWWASTFTWPVYMKPKWEQTSIVCQFAPALVLIN